MISHRRKYDIRYDTTRDTIFSCTEKLTGSQLNLPHGTNKTEKVIKRTKSKKVAQKKRSGHEVPGVSPEAE